VQQGKNQKDSRTCRGLGGGKKLSRLPKNPWEQRWKGCARWGQKKKGCKYQLTKSGSHRKKRGRGDREKLHKLESLSGYVRNPLRQPRLLEGKGFNENRGLGTPLNPRGTWERTDLDWGRPARDFRMKKILRPKFEASPRMCVLSRKPKEIGCSYDYEDKRRRQRPGGMQTARPKTLRGGAGWGGSPAGLGGVLLRTSQ